MSNTSLFGSESQFGNIGSWRDGSPHVQLTVAKISISTIVHWFAAVSLHNWEHNHYIVTILWTTTTWPDPLLAQSFSAAATKGWAWCHHLMQRWRNVLRLSGTWSFWQVGCLEFQQGIVGMDSLNKHVEHISFPQCITFCEHRQLKGWQPHVPTHCC